jgi:hypothetical protein
MRERHQVKLGDVLQLRAWAIVTVGHEPDEEKNGSDQREAEAAKRRNPKW